MFSIRLSPPLCPGVVLESLEPEFRRFHAGRSELHAKKGAGVLFERTFFVAGSVELGACVFEKERLCAFDRSITEIRLINHPAKGPAPPGSILFSVPVGVHATKKRGENEENQEKEQGTSHLAAVRELRPDLAGWYTGENSGGVPPRSLYVELAAGGCTRARGPCAECRVRRACC